MTNRTKNASTEDDNDNTGPLAEWAVKLTADLKDKEKAALKNIKQQGTPEFQEAALVLQNFVKKAAKHVQKPSKSKPGPKKSVNPTDDDIATLWSCIRMILELPPETKIPSVLETLTEVFKMAQKYLSEHLLLTRNEFEGIRYRQQWWVSLASQDAFLKGLINSFGNIDVMDANCSLAKWAQAFHSSSRPKRAHSECSTGVQRIDAALVALAKTMGLDKLRRIESNRARVDQDPESDRWVFVELDKCETLEDIPLERKELLWTAIQRLFRWNFLFLETGFVWKPRCADSLLFDIETKSEPSAMRCDYIKLVRNPVAEDFGSVDRLVKLASKRQEVSPFSEIHVELEPPLPRPTKPTRQRKISSPVGGAKVGERSLNKNKPKGGSGATKKRRRDDGK